MLDHFFCLGECWKSLTLPCRLQARARSCSPSPRTWFGISCNLLGSATCISGSVFKVLELVLDSLFSETREQNYEKFLMPAFKDEVRSRAKNPEHRREKFSSNSLFEKSSKLDKTVKDLSKNDSKVWFIYFRFQFLNSFLQISKVVKFRSDYQAKGSGGGGGGGSRSGAGPSKAGAGNYKSKHHGGRNSRSKKKYKGGGSSKGSYRDNKDSSKDARDSKESKPAKEDKSKKGETLCFLELWNSGFMPEAIAAVSNAGIDISLALDAANVKTPGRISMCMSNWKCVSSDAWVLNVVKNGYSLDFKDGPPDTPYHGRNPPADDQAVAILDKEAAAVVEKGAAIIVQHSSKEVISGFFARPKKEKGKWRPIVNLKFLNKHLRKVKFSMTTVADIRKSIQPGYFFVSIDLTDAYYSVGLNESAWPFVRFAWQGKIYEYHVLLFGLAPSPRVFTKMATAAVKFLKAVFLIWVAGYIDDFLIQAPTAWKSRLHAEICILIFHCLGYEVNFSKSHLTPSTKIEHLGFVFDSLSMTISVPELKVTKIIGLVSGFLDRDGLTVDELQSLVGRLESVRPAVELAPLHYRSLQCLLRPFLRSEVSGSIFLPLSQGARADLRWWAELSPSRSTAPLRRDIPSVQMSADASGLVGWGGHSSRGQFCQGNWLGQEKVWHINQKELVAAKRSVINMMEEGDTILMNLDSRTAAAFINRMGGTRSRSLCKTALDLWRIVLDRQGWIKANWLPREENQLADLLSKEAIDTWEISLLPLVATRLWDRWFIPYMDMFASARCHLLDRYCSWYPDSGAVQRDAFCLEKWPNKVYCFPPVPLVAMTLDRIVQDKVARAIMIVPQWPMCLWWTKLQEMLVEDPLELDFYRKILLSPLNRKLPYLNPLLACLVTGNC